MIEGAVISNGGLWIYNNVIWVRESKLHGMHIGRQFEMKDDLD